MLDRIMGLPSERVPDRPYLPMPKLRGQLALREVSFAYPKGTHDHAQSVLKDLNVNILPGQRVAILGKMGSGKSTVLRLLAGLYQPTDGMVEVDGLDLRQVDPTDYRAHVGFVAQEPRLFSGTLRDNILLGRAHADPRLLASVLQMTGLDKVVANHPMGLDMQVGEGGCMLSGGQRQLVALARCLITKPCGAADGRADQRDGRAGRGGLRAAPVGHLAQAHAGGGHAPAGAAGIGGPRHRGGLGPRGGQRARRPR